MQCFIVYDPLTYNNAYVCGVLVHEVLSSCPRLGLRSEQKSQELVGAETLSTSDYKHRAIGLGCYWSVGLIDNKSSGPGLDAPEKERDEAYGHMKFPTSP